MYKRTQKRSSAVAAALTQKSSTLPAESASSSAANVQVQLPETGFLRLPQVKVFFPVSSATLWRRVGAGSFPRPVKLGPRVTAWRAEDVRRWIADQGAPQ
jgi:predicted DNA-binding transcriptional regulator AlpA